MENIYDVFISYSRKDYLKEDEKTPDPEKIVSKILKKLDENNISYWIDKEGMCASAQFTALLEQNITNSTCFLFVSTQNANVSQSIIGEVFTAKDLGKPILPFRADNSNFGNGIGFLLRPLHHIEYFKIGDEAFDLLVLSINKIKAILSDYKKVTNDYNQVEDVYKRAKDEYKRKLQDIADSMEILGIKSPVCIPDEEPRRESLTEYAQTKGSTVNSKDRNYVASNEPNFCVVKLKEVEFKMIRVDGNTFTMGATSEIEFPYTNESPAHHVTLNTYYIGETSVTQNLWEAVMEYNPSFIKGDNLPVHNISWDDCQKFIKKLNQTTGKKFRLPSDAEWEFAARGGIKSKHFQYSGSNKLDDVAWYKGNSRGQIHPTKSKKPNELGIYDMSGGLWEWCQDRYGYYDSYAQVNPTGPSRGVFRVRRGGSWGNDARECHVSSRSGHSPDFRNKFFGLRLAITEL